MNKLFTLTFLILFSTLSFAQGEHVGGGGVSENNLIFSWNSFSTYFKRFIILEDEQLTSKEKTFGELLLSRNDIEKGLSRISFHTENEVDFNGAFFLSQKVVGGSIQFNLDRLFVISAGIKRPFTIIETMGHILEILKRDTTILTTNEFNILKSKFQDTLQINTEIISLKSYSREELQLISMESKNITGILMMDSKKLHDVTSFINSKLFCPNKSMTAKVHHLANLYLKQFAEADFFNFTQNIFYKGFIQYTCKNDSQLLKVKGEFLLAASYALETKKPEVQITSSWMSNPAIDAIIDPSKTELFLRDLIIE